MRRVLRAVRTRESVDALAALLDSPWVTRTAVVLVVLSVWPGAGFEERLRGLFLAAFGLEWSLRVYVRAKAPERRRRYDGLFLALDFVAFASFIPVPEALDGEAAVTVVRLLRLLRLLVLVRATRAVAVDFASVVGRREQVRQLLFVTVTVLALSYVTAVVLTQLLVPHDYDGLDGGPEGFWDRMWWAFRQLESPDNLVSSLAVHPLLGAVSLVLSLVGVFIFSYLVGVGTSIVEQIAAAGRRRPIELRRHMVLVGPSVESRTLAREFTRITEKNRMVRAPTLVETFDYLRGRGPRPRRHALPGLAILGQEESPHPSLLEAELRHVQYRQGDASREADLELVAVREARRVLVLADPPRGLDADAVAIARLAAIRETNPHAHVYVELRRDDHAGVARAVGGEATHVLVVPKMIGLLLGHHLVTPGVDRVYRQLLMAEGHEIYSHVFIDAHEHAQLARLVSRGATWKQVGERAFERHGVVLLASIEGEAPARVDAVSIVDESELVPVLLCGEDRLAQPFDATRVRGFVGIAEHYGPMRAAARALLEEPPDAHTKPGLASRARAVREPDVALRRVLLVGWGLATAALVETLDALAPGVRIDLVLAFRTGEEARLTQAQAELEFALSGTLSAADTIGLPHGSSLVVHRYTGANRTGFAVEVAVRDAAGQVDALVVHPDQGASDQDAATVLFALKLVQAVAARRLRDEAREAPLHVLLELGHLLSERSLARQVRAVVPESVREATRVTQVSTEELKAYFLVQGAFVPTIVPFYEALLSVEGPRLRRFAFDLPGAAPDASIRFSDVYAAMSERGAIAIAVDVDDELLVNPARDAAIPLASLRAVYALA